MPHYRLMLAGLGNVGRSLLDIMQSQANLLRDRYDLTFSVVVAADSGGAAVDAGGLNIPALLAAKRAGASVAALDGVGRAGVAGAALFDLADVDVLLESTPVNLHTGEPGLTLARTALQRGVHVVIANKGPVALAFQELTALSNNGPRLRYSACVGGYMPTVNVGQRDLRGANISKVEGVLNGTTQIILRAMERGGTYADALKDAQERGLAETDPTLDVEGWDAANKLVIVANAVLGQPATLDDVDVTGITRLTRDDLQSALGFGTRIMLLCLAERGDDGFRLSVRPTALPLEHPLARMSADEMGVVYYSDIGGRTSLTTLERGPEPTAAAMLRDLIDVCMEPVSLM